MARPDSSGPPGVLKLQLSDLAASSSTIMPSTIPGCQAMRSVISELPIWRVVIGLLVVSTSTRATELREIRGRVVDDKGLPVAKAVVADFWRANGTGKDRDGKYFDPQDRRERKEVLGPTGSDGAVRPAAGRDNRVRWTIHRHNPRVEARRDGDGPRSAGAVGC